MTAGDIACSPSSSSFNGGQGTSSKCRQLATSDLLLSGNPDAVLPLGDLQYENATLSDFLGSYDLSWGTRTIAAKTYPVSGNHEYQTSGGAGYYQYWQQKTGQDKAHQATNGYYSFELGAWHIVVLNSNCSAAGGCGSTSPQVQWLRADLQASPDASARLPPGTIHSSTARRTRRSRRTAASSRYGTRCTSAVPRSS